MKQETKFSRPAAELSCIIGNLFTSVQPPCEYLCGDDLVVCGVTHSQQYGKLTVKNDFCVFEGDPEDLYAVLKSKCIERRCRHGR